MQGKLLLLLIVIVQMGKNETKQNNWSRGVVWTLDFMRRGL